MVCQPFRGKVVRVLGGHIQISTEALLSSLEMDPWFTRLDAHGAHCWHVVNVVHRVRLMRARDATVERWGSLLHQLPEANLGLLRSGWLVVDMSGRTLHSPGIRSRS